MIKIFKKTGFFLLLWYLLVKSDKHLKSLLVKSEEILAEWLKLWLTKIDKIDWKKAEKKFNNKVY